MRARRGFELDAEPETAVEHTISEVTSREIDPTRKRFRVAVSCIVVIEVDAENTPETVATMLEKEYTNVVDFLVEYPGEAIETFIVVRDLATSEGKVAYVRRK